ncbi:MarR family transcriptional regulator [Mycobacterium sp. CVI_P3]|uniref:MarR family transcriptional regulator n=1 Tax=Mycobacterium pinniadriaticum TaxID=2994102 RepID=A0ABT3SKJ5_9MYCO|nr:MarR family transcriptional regulator [Mycobacterium pinniadriaticum]MCX2933594.1 MarR family transcriptional regulator [Mycobacterium pinniadriaticum]MCX2940016.1 MarR family transcriptional regulator [Mycobacterium pinniadriaticum]
MADDVPTTPTLMFIAHRAAEAQVMAAVTAGGNDDLTLAQARLLQRMHPNGIRVTDLADQAGVTKQTAGALVDQLEGSGYVRRVADPADARARLVILTDKGLTLCQATAAEVAKIEHQWRKHLGAKRYHELRAALVDLREITDPYH